MQIDFDNRVPTPLSSRLQTILSGFATGSLWTEADAPAGSAATAGEASAIPQSSATAKFAVAFMSILPLTFGNFRFGVFAIRSCNYRSIGGRAI